MEQANDSMRGRVCLVTGGNSGVGKATAQALAKMGATVVIVCRDRKRGEAAQSEIQSKSSNTSVDLLLADLSSQRSIHQLATNFMSKYQHLHVLVNNAGAVNTERSTTVDGLETTFAVNHLAYFLLTNLLLDVLKASTPARIISISSSYERMGTINFEDLQSEEQYRGLRAYGQSKLANILFTYELARRLEGTGVTANCLAPGPTATNFGHNTSGLLHVLLTAFERFAAPPEKGAETPIYLATSPEVEGITGRYFVKCREAKSSKRSYDDALRRRLWQVSEELTRLSEVTQ